AAVAGVTLPERAGALRKAFLEAFRPLVRDPTAPVQPPFALVPGVDGRLAAFFTSLSFSLVRDWRGTVADRPPEGFERLVNALPEVIEETIRERDGRASDWTGPIDNARNWLQSKGWLGMLPPECLVKLGGECAGNCFARQVRRDVFGL